MLKDNFIPLFDNKPSSYKEYRQRLQLYKKKAKLNKKVQEATINLLTSLSGAAWKQVQHLADEAPDQGEEGFDKVVKALDQAFKYDDRVEMPKALDKFLYGLQKRPDQTLLQYCGDHREALFELEKHGIKLPSPVLGWILLKRAGLTAEQRQLVQTRCGDNLEPDRVEQAMFYLFGQDYRTQTRAATTKPVWRGQGAGSSLGGWRRYGHAHAATEEPSHEDDGWDDNGDDEEAYYDGEENDAAEEAWEEEQDWEDYALYEDEWAEERCMPRTLICVPGSPRYELHEDTIQSSAPKDRILKARDSYSSGPRTPTVRLARRPDW